MVTDAVSQLASWGGLIMGAVAVIPRMMAVLSRKRESDTKGEISRFETILTAQESQLKDCKSECEKIEVELLQERAERIRERDYFLRQMAESTRRLNDCEGMLRRKGVTDDRKMRRTAG
jgi:hypothetical protein